MTTDNRVVDDLADLDGSDPRQPIDVDVIDLRLPCRQFRVHYKVAETGQFSLTTEFLLRLLRLGDGMREDDIARFFAFSGDETRFVIDYVESLGFARRRDGRVFLTDAGHAQFRSADDPALFEVHPKQDRFEFDLVSWAPAESRRQLSPFESKLPEIPIGAPEEVGRGSTRVLQSFARYFQEFRAKRGGSRLEKETLYSVDDVQAEQRYSTIVPVAVAVRPDDPSIAETTLLEWRDAGELQDRPEIVDGCASFVRDICNAARPPRPIHAEWMVQCAPEQLSRFVKDGVFNTHDFFSSTSRQAGELRIDRQTVRLIGNLWTDANRVRFAAALRYAVRRGADAPKMVLWLRPPVRYWGMTNRLEDIGEAVRQQFRSGDSGNSPVRTVLLGDDGVLGIFKNAFQAIVNVGNVVLENVAEVFLVPGHVAFLAVHTIVGPSGGYPIPLGVISFNPDVVRRTTELLKTLLAPPHARQVYCDWHSPSLLDEVDASLETKTTGTATDSGGSA